MVGKIAICRCGGEFDTDTNGTISYKGGEAHAIDLDEHMKFSDFIMEVKEMFNSSSSSCVNAVSINYLLPTNSKTLITISNDKDLKRMISFHAHSPTADIYVIIDEMPDLSNMPASRSSRTTLSEAAPPAAAIQVQPLCTMPCDHTDIEISPTLPVVVLSNDDYNYKHAKGAQMWQNSITGVGQRFNSVNEFRESLRKYAISHQFAFKYKKNDSHRVTVKCKAEGCPWRIHASRLSTTQLICIKKMNQTHTCDGAAVTSGHQATRSWVAGIIKDKLKVSPNYKPKDIVNDIKQEYGIQLNYFQAWRGKEIAKEQLHGSYKEAYNQLPIFCKNVMETNPGSRATFTTKEDSSFHRLFVSFHASMNGFLQGCRPLLFLEGIPLNSKYQGSLLAATAVDGDDNIFPLAFAVVDAESDDNWHWFLLQLNSALSTSCPLTFVADKHKGLKDSLAEIFKGSYHAYCLRYLTEQFIGSLKGQLSQEVKRLMIEDVYAAAYAPTPESFQRSIDSIKSLSHEAYDWIVQSEPQNWANAFFEGARYNHMTSNFGELFYSWVSDAHESPITQMVDMLRCKMMELIYTRRAASEKWLTRLTPSMEEKLEKENLKVASLQVLQSAGSTFEVGGDTMEVVDTDRWDCSCKGWQLTGLPCCHAISVFYCIGCSPYDYCSRYLTTESYKLSYSQSIHPLPSAQKDYPQDSVTVTPPPTRRRPPGRPTTTKRFGSQDAIKRQLHCGICKGLGHNKSTCNQNL